MPSNNFIVGEMQNKRTPNTKTWMNFDGSYTTEIYQGPVHFDDGLNNLHNINTSLFDEADADTYDGPSSGHGKKMLKHEKDKVKDKKKKGKMNRDDFDYQVPTLPFSVQIPKNIKKGYSIGQNDEFVRFIPQNVSPSKGYVNKAKYNEIQYQDAWNDTDIILEVTDRGIKETMLLKTDRAPSTFSFEVDGAIEDDLTMGNMKLEPAWLIDAVGEKRDVPQTVRREGEQTYIDLVADVEGLVYPIEIDPTVTIQPDGTAGKDATIHGNAFNGNYSGSNLEVGGDTGGSDTYRSLIQFDLSAIPTGSSISAATMILLMWSQQSGIVSTIQLNEILQSWGETTVTWGNQPTINATPTSTLQSIGVTNHNFDVRTIVGEWVSGNKINNGLMLKNQSESTASTRKSFRSSDTTSAGDRPKLSITYNVPPTAPTVTVPNGGETWNSSHTVEWLGAKDGYQEVTTETVGGSASLVVSQPKVGQTFKITSANFDLLSVDIWLTGATTVSVEIWDVNNGLPTTMLQSTQITTVANAWTNVALNRVGLIKDKQYAIVLSRVTADGDVKISGNNPYPNGNFVNFNGTSWLTSSTSDMLLKVNTNIQINLQYQIQLSTDNGTNWSDIVALTLAGVTQYIHDFINAPQTSTAKIRIRAFDGTSYGPWDESDGVFSIIHNVAPSAPTNLTPVTTKDRAEVIRFAWQHNDQNTDAQSKFDLDYRLQGTTTWNTVTQNTINQFYDLPGGTLPRGTIEWRVRTYDQADLSGPYSELKTFFAGDKPSKPTTLNPVDGSIVSVSNPTIQWSSVGQVGYNLKVLDANETEVLWETNQTSNNKAHTVGYSLENEIDYVIQLTIRNVDGINSDVEKSRIHVSYTPPAVPNLSIIGEGNLSTISLSIENPVPVNTEPVVTHHDLFRRKVGDSKWTRIVDNVALNGSYIDYTPASEQVYEYYVRAWGDNGTYRDSAVVNESITLKSIWLVDPDEPESLHHFRYFEPGRTSDRIVRGQMMEFEGRSLGMAEFSSAEQKKINVVLQMKKNSGDLEALHDLLSRHTAILYRDAKGRRIYGAIFSLSENETDYGYTVPIEVQAVSYEEGV